MSDFEAEGRGRPRVSEGVEVEEEEMREERVDVKFRLEDEEVVISLRFLGGAMAGL